jgi:predicted NAD/FAD-binding protein
MGEYRHTHPVFTVASLAAQAMLPGLQGRGGVWFCGAWTGNGFHEDGLQSGFSTADDILAYLQSVEKTDGQIRKNRREKREGRDHFSLH